MEFDAVDVVGVDGCGGNVRVRISFGEICCGWDGCGGGGIAGGCLVEDW